METKSHPKPDGQGLRLFRGFILGGHLAQVGPDLWPPGPQGDQADQIQEQAQADPDRILRDKSGEDQGIEWPGNQVKAGD